MGGKLVSSSLSDREGGSNPSSLFTYKELFEKACPKYMHMGMTYDEFWYDDPLKAKYYREQFKLDREQANENAWLQGVYIRKAIGSAFSSENEYPDNPLPIDDEMYEEYKQREYEKEYALAKAFYDSIQ